MHYRQFGSTGWNVSEVGLGTWQFGGDWGKISEQTARLLLKTAIDHGVNFFDTADVYGEGRSESIIGGYLGGGRDDLYIASKLGRMEGFPDGYSADLFRRCIENSLRRLRREAVDLIQLHCIPQKWLEDGRVFDWLRTLKEEGKVRAFGASVETLEEAFICLKQPDIASLQIIFNIFRQRPADELFGMAEKNGTALIIRLPLASGLLAGRFTSATTFSESDHRTYNRNGEAFSPGETFSGLEFSYGLECVEKVRTYVPAGISMAQFALRWILDYHQVGVVIPGASKTGQVEGNCAASGLSPLSGEVHSAVRDLFRDIVESHIRGRV
jgi:aryl-alcohol dehydrogenase-like predicted oxidoreductase